VETDMPNPRLTPIDLALLDGYQRGTPPWSPDVAAIDGPIARDYPCPRCETSCSYVPLHHRTRRSYRAFARCESCCHNCEF
jgi:hypothetical protein